MALRGELECHGLVSAVDHWEAPPDAAPNGPKWVCTRTSKFARERRSGNDKNPSDSLDHSGIVSAVHNRRLFPPPEGMASCCFSLDTVFAVLGIRRLYTPADVATLIR